MEIDGKPKKLSWRDLEVLTDSFSKENFIVNVQFGKLYRGKTPDAQELTVKIRWLPPDEVCTIVLCDDAIVDRLERELSVLTNPDLGNHPNLVKLIGYCCEDQGSHYGVVYDVRSKDSLLNLIEKDDFTWTQRMQAALGVARVLEHLHERNYLVCNVHPAHVILDQDSNPVLLDFSLRPDRTIAKRYPNYPCTVYYGYDGYIDPLFVHNGFWVKRADVFSFGIVLLELITKFVFDQSKCDAAREFPAGWAQRQYRQKLNSSSQPVGCLLVHKSFDSAPDFDVCDGVAITKLAVHCVDLDERKRPTMTQIVNYLQGIIDEWDTQSTEETAGKKKNSNAENERKSLLPLFDHED
uniref:Protein kinase domain-containing protein n=1 Tax=Quercus lobata TaxID=97700 RepID=A0A7N2LKE9_QUELO